MIRKRLLILIPLLCIFLLAIFLRVYQLESAPPLFVDEVSIGYNAFSILETGKDEYGKTLPLSFAAFGDHKLPLYIYASVPAVKLFGLTTLGVRFVSILAGGILVFVIFSLLKELKFTPQVALVGALITAVSPWTIMLGRFAWESNLALLLFCSGLLFAVKAIHTQKIQHYMFVAIFFALTWYAYLPYRLITVFLIAFLLLAMFKKQKKKCVLLVITFIILLLPLFPVLTSSAGTARLKQTSIFTDPQINVIVNENRTYCLENSSKLPCYLLSNKPIEFGYDILSNLNQIFSLKFLFISGEDAKFVSVQSFGLLPHFLIPFYLLGFIALYMIWKKGGKKLELLLLAVGISAATLPILITNSPHRIQMSGLFPFFLILIIYGYNLSLMHLKSKLVYPVVFVGLVFFGVAYTFIFTNIHSKKYYDTERMIADISRYIGQQDKLEAPVYVKDYYQESLTYYAFYNSIDPIKYQKQVKVGEKDRNGFFHGIQLENINVVTGRYEDFVCTVPNKDKKALYITNENIHKKDSTGKILPVKTFTTRNGVHELGYAYLIADLTQKTCNIQ